MSRRAVEIEEVADGDDGDVEMGVLLQDVAQSYDYSVGPAGAGAPTAKEAGAPQRTAESHRAHG